MEFSNTDKHRASLEVMREVLAYLKRLPPVPVTVEFIEKVEAHLAEPTQHLVQQSKRELHAQSFTASGIPLIEVTVSGDHVHLQIPRSGRRFLAAQGDLEGEGARHLTQLLCNGGLTLPLEPKRRRTPG